MKQPDWVHCVEHTEAESWCGKTLPLTEWRFLGADHAAENGRQGGRLVACRGCVEAISAALRNGHDDPDYLAAQLARRLQAAAYSHGYEDAQLHRAIAAESETDRLSAALRIRPRHCSGRARGVREGLRFPVGSAGGRYPTTLGLHGVRRRPPQARGAVLAGPVHRGFRSGVGIGNVFLNVSFCRSRFAFSRSASLGGAGGLIGDPKPPGCGSGSGLVSSCASCLPFPGLKLLR